MWYIVFFYNLFIYFVFNCIFLNEDGFELFFISSFIVQKYNLISKIKENIIQNKYEASRGDWLWVRSPQEEIKYLFTFIFSFLRSGVEAKARRWVPPPNTQCLQNSAESGQRSVLTLGSFCLHCCVREQREADKKKQNK